MKNRLGIFGLLGILCILQACRFSEESPTPTILFTPTVVKTNTRTPQFVKSPQPQASATRERPTTIPTESISLEKALEMSYLKLLSAKPNMDTLLIPDEPFSYRYEFEYYIANIDWGLYNYEPTLWLFATNQDASIDIIDSLEEGELQLGIPTQGLFEGEAWPWFVDHYPLDLRLHFYDSKDRFFVSITNGSYFFDYTVKQQQP